MKCHFVALKNLPGRKLLCTVEKQNEWWWTLTAWLEVRFVFGQAQKGDPEWDADRIVKWQTTFVRWYQVRRC